MKGYVKMKIKNLFENSIVYSLDVLNIVNEYCDTMDLFFTNIDNQVAYDMVYQEYLCFKLKLKEKAIERGFNK